MRSARAGLLLAAVSLLAVLVLGQLPRLSERVDGRRASPAVFAPMSVQTMTQESMVDAFAGLRLQSKLSRLTLENGILAVDLTIVEDGTVALGVWSDAASLVELSFAKVHNVRQLLIRVFREAQGKKVMLLSADTRAADWDPASLADLHQAITGIEPIWAPKIRPDWTRSGEGWKRNFAK